MRKTTRLRQRVTRPEIAFLMEAHSGLSARIAEDAGFEGIWGSGTIFATCSTPPGFPCRRGRAVIELTGKAP